MDDAVWSRIDVHQSPRQLLNRLHGPPKESKLKGLLPCIRAVGAVAAAAHDRYSRLPTWRGADDAISGFELTPRCSTSRWRLVVAEVRTTGKRPRPCIHEISRDWPQPLQCRSRCGGPTL